jgi:hypothetical protein
LNEVGFANLRRAVGRERSFIAEADHSKLKSEREEIEKAISGLICGLDRRQR